MLTALEQLEDMAHENDISVVSAHFSDTKKAACVHTDYKLIVLDKPRIETPAEETALFAEELGHYETGALYVVEATHNTPLARSNRVKCEAKAKRWAIKKILPPEKIQKALDNYCRDDYELAEYCQVPMDFLREAYAYYIQAGVTFHCCLPD